MSPNALWRDFAAGLRAHATTPLATMAIVSVLSLGIAATSVSFSIVNRLFIRPLPIEHGDRFVRIYRQAGAGAPYFPLSHRHLEDVRDLRSVFDATAGEEPAPFIIGVNGSYERAFGEILSDGYFRAMGVRPALGRLITAEDERHSERVVVLSDGFWKRGFGGDRGVIGRDVPIDGRSYRVIGVAPAGFGGTILGFSSDAWISRASLVGSGVQPDESSYFTLARLAPGVHIAQAQTALGILSRRLQQERPAADRGVSLLAYSESQGRVLPTFRGSALTASALAIAVSLLVTLIACANVAGLLLARADARRGEIGVRLALGASRARIVSQLLTESAALAIASGAIGILLAWQATRLLSDARVVIARGAVVGLDVTLDWRVLAISVVIAGMSAILFGLAPALEASRPDLVAILRHGDRSGRRSTSWSRRIFLGAQVVVSMMLLATAGLCARSLLNARETDLGFDPSGVVTTAIDIRASSAPTRNASAFWSTLLDDVKRLPQTQSATLTYRLPLELGMVTWSIGPEGFQPADDQAWPTIEYSPISTGYFSTLRMTLVEGRDFSDREVRGGDARVVIVNDVLAGRFWPNSGALGRFVVAPDGQRFEVVGVVRRSKYLSLTEEPKPYMYVPVGDGGSGAMSIVARGSGDTTSHLRAIAGIVRRLDPHAAFYDVGTMTSRVETALAPTTSLASSLAIVGLIALGLTSLGLFAAVAEAVGRRTYEIGVRRALGAPDHSIARLVTSDTIVLVAGGLAVGVGLSLIASRALARLLYNVDPLDPAAHAVAPAVLLAVCLTAVWLPTRRALRVDAARALRHD
jgi:putative ABC transport system permease protein